MKKLKKDELLGLAQQAIATPKEALAPVLKKEKKFSIGIPKESYLFETRVPVTPNGVRILVGAGFEVIIESEAGKHARFSDLDYSESGAFVTNDQKKVLKSDIIVKVTLPSLDEIEHFNQGAVIFTSLNSPFLTPEQIKSLIKKKLTVFCYENLKDESGILPLIQSMSEIAGIEAINIAAGYLSEENGKGILLGSITGVQPAEIVVLGAGTVGYYAAKTADSLGANVKIFDRSISKLRTLRTFKGLNVYNAVLQNDALEKALEKADVVIGAIRGDLYNTPCVVSEEMVAKMKKGTVLVDVSIDQGGCFATSKVTNLKQPYFIKHDVIHYCVPNIPARVPRTASIAMSDILVIILNEIIDSGSLENFLWEKPHSRSGVCIYKGILTNSTIGSMFNLKSNSLEILMTSNL